VDKEYDEGKPAMRVEEGHRIAGYFFAGSAYPHRRWLSANLR